MRLWFTDDVGVLPILGFVACKCRDWAVRQDALSLLERCDWREGSWDGASLWSAARALVDLETQGMVGVGGFVPASARFAWTDSHGSGADRSMQLQLTRLLPGVDGEYERKAVQVRTVT